MSTERPHCVIVGIGPGTGAACARRFSEEGYKVSIISRSDERLAEFHAAIPHTMPYRADLKESEAYRETLERIVARHGVPRVVVHNATQASFGRYDEIDIKKFERNFLVNAGGLLITAQVFGPKMAERGEGSIIVTGNTAAVRGKPNYVGWAPTKAAQRILAEALARELGPQGVHVSYVIIDAAIDMPFARRSRSERPDDFFAKPDDLAGEIYHVAHQPRSAWSFLVELRPFGETW
ncbi:MAG: SDR family NAD(P)-dependent oxidoreductase [Chromatiales bacterium]|jgi:short-subunit dehydrogenase|nr:SDR family NAD(P)-dependent oxidoreductase [Chromatiales bacterium]